MPILKHHDLDRRTFGMPLLFISFMAGILKHEKSRSHHGEVNFKYRLNLYGFARKKRWLKSPLPYSFDSRFCQRTLTSHQSHFSNRPVLINNHVKDDGAFNMSTSHVRGVIRLDSMNRLWRRYVCRTA